jgi:hypothetical protein
MNRSPTIHARFLIAAVSRAFPRLTHLGSAFGSVVVRQPISRIVPNRERNTFTPAALSVWCVASSTV